MTRILVLHGPNLNLLGTREPGIYGSATLADIDVQLATLATSLGASVECRQSNSEGQLVDWIHEAQGAAEGLLFNLGAYTHTSIAIADALRAVALPCVEVHLSNVHAREPFRRLSYSAEVAIGVVTGFGPQSYTLGLRGLLAQID